MSVSGGKSGIGQLYHRNHDGAGVQVVLAGVFSTKVERDAPVPKAVLYDRRPTSVPFAQSWLERFSPKIVRRRSDGRCFVDTKFTRLVGRPPVMVAGMTPTTVNHELVAATLNAGYHCELAGGGLPRENLFRAKVDALLAAVDHGHGISFNLMYLTPKLWRFQFPLVCALARSGYAIDGVCVAAGVPSPDVATSILADCADAGIRHVSFKPGSVSLLLLTVCFVIHCRR